MKILVTPTSFNRKKNPEAVQKLEQFADEVIYNPYGRPLNEDEIIEMFQGVDGYIAGLDNITAKVIDAAPDSLKIISRYGVGVDRVDLKAAKDKGITVTNTPSVNTEAVADLAITLLLCVARNVIYADGQVKAGYWPRCSGIDVCGKTLGIIGLGAIGKGVARRAQGFDMTVLAYDPYLDEEYAEAHNIQSVTMEEVIRESDFISLHLPFNDTTRNIINADVFNQMKDGAILVNTARGGIIDEQAAYEALQSGKLAGLGLDVFETEPPGDSPLFKLDNVVTTPHMGAKTAQSVKNMGMAAVNNLIAILNDEPYENVVI